MAANPLAPIKGTRVPSVGARAPNPAAMAGAAKPPVIASNAPPVKAAAPIIPPRFHFSHLLLGDAFS
uniref:Uncharacterized protein n=1 Tax=Arundo donax TaxID=35708 RepID=A0A0A9E121_ARUDO